MGQYLQLKGKEAELKKKKLSLVTAFKAKGRAIKDCLTMLSVSPVEDIDADAVLHHARGLKDHKDEIEQINKDLQAIRHELGED